MSGEFLARTGPDAPGLRVVSAEGCWITAGDGRRYLDWLAGIGVCNLGHRHPAVLTAARAQEAKHLHVMVYGEYAQAAQETFAGRLAGLAPFPDARVYFTSSGAEAVEGALKLARKATGRPRFAAFDGAYHGSTFGAFSLMGPAAMRAPYAPLLDVLHLPFGDAAELERIDRTVAAVVVEPIQAEAGVRVPPPGFLTALRKRCDATGALLVFDEVQTGLGRTGTLWAGESVAPDVLVLAKALGGGYPLGAFLAPARLMAALADGPPLTHLTTFGGHPVSCAAGLASLEVTLAQDLPARARHAGGEIMAALSSRIDRGGITAVRGRGLLIGVELESVERARAIVSRCLASGLLIGQALHDERVLRLTPPLTLADADLRIGLERLVSTLT